MQQIPDLFTQQILINAINNHHEFLSLVGHSTISYRESTNRVLHEVTMFHHYFTTSRFPYWWTRHAPQFIQMGVGESLAAYLKGP